MALQEEEENSSSVPSGSGPAALKVRDGAIFKQPAEERKKKIYISGMSICWKSKCPRNQMEEELLKGREEDLAAPRRAASRPWCRRENITHAL